MPRGIKAGKSPEIDFFEKFNTGFAQRDRHLNVFFFCFLFLTYTYPN